MSEKVELTEAEQYVMDNFDFDKVAQMMLEMGWEWETGRQAHIPTTKELRETVTELLVMARGGNGPYSSIATGGLIVIKSKDILRLGFMPVESEHWDDNFVDLS